MDKIIKVVEFENFEDEAKALPVPLNAYLVCQDDNQDVILIYERAA